MRFPIALGVLGLLLPAVGCNDTTTSVGTRPERLGVADPSLDGANPGLVENDGDVGDVSLYVSSGNTHSVLAYNGKSGAFQRSFARCGGLIEPEGITFGPDGNLYVSSRSNAVLRYDGKTGKFIDVFAVGHNLRIRPASSSADHNDLFVSSPRRRPSSDPPVRRRMAPSRPCRSFLHGRGSTTRKR
jgi:hypothetical protein